MKRFEYQVIDTLNFPFQPAHEIEDYLNGQGQLGWELVTVVDGRFEVFKRTLNTENKDNAITEDELDEPEQTQEQIQEEYRHSFSS